MLLYEYLPGMHTLKALYRGGGGRTHAMFFPHFKHTRLIVSSSRIWKPVVKIIMAMEIPGY